MDVKELENNTVAELKKIAKELGIPGISAMKKADLVTAIAGAADAPEPEPEVEAAPEPEVEASPEPEVEATPEPEVEASASAEATADEAPESQEAEPVEAPEAEATPEPEVEAAPEPASKPEPAPAPKPAPAPEPEPKVKEIVLTKAQIRLNEKHDVPALKLEKRALRSQIMAAIADQDFAKMKELRNRKKELRRLLNRI